MRALPGPAPEMPRVNGHLGGSDLLIPLAVMPGVPFLFSLIAALAFFGWLGLLIELGFVAALITSLALFATREQRRAARVMRNYHRVWAKIAAERAFSTIHEDPITEPAKITSARPQVDVFITEDGRIVFYDRA